MHRDFTPTAKDIERFWSKVDQSGGTDSCWPYMGSRTIQGPNGYGAFAFRVTRGVWRNIVGSRFAWRVTNGPIPPGICVLHRCDNRPCCNPSHLFLGTKQDNMDDMKSKGRQRRGETTRTAKLTAGSVMEIRCRFASGATCVPDLAREYGTTDRSMQDVVYGRSWRHVS